MRSHPTDIISAMLEMLRTFESRCQDTETLARLIATASDQARWSGAKKLFEDIRRKTLAAGKRGDVLAEAQYAFEEICAKTLYNLSHPSAPFDADSAFWVMPLAVDLGRRLGLSQPGDVSTLLNMPPA